MSPFVRPYALGIDEMLADGAVDLFRKRGVDALNVAALARWMRISRQALHERLWDPEGTRRRIMRLTLLAFAERWLDWVQLALLDDPPVPALPSTEEEAHGVRVWAGLQELARGERSSGNPDPAAVVAATLVREGESLKARVAAWVGANPSDEDLAELLALTDGLRASLIESVPRISYDQARALLARRLEALRSPPSATGTPPA